jgi:phage shock protein PspC (stress-responsive transcriptional regulator)
MMTDGPEPRRLERDTSNQIIAGVASGVANYFNLDPTIVRLLWVATILLGGFGVIIYVIMWIIVPEARTPTTSETAENGAPPAEEATDAGTEPTEPKYDEPSDEA